MKKTGMLVLIFILFSLVIINPVIATVPSAEDAANKADEVIYRRLPFTFDCDFCHVNGEAPNEMVPHSTSLEYHDKLVFRNQTGCFICHDYYQRSKLKLMSGELAPFEESPKLCYQCHQKRYDTWFNGDHGKSDLRCSDFKCHNPHNPRLFKVSLGIGYPLPPPLAPPEPAVFTEESNGEPYYDAVVLSGKVFIVTLVLVFLISILMILNRNKWRPDN